jgi:hypothetical protein
MGGILHPFSCAPSLIRGYSGRGMKSGFLKCLYSLLEEALICPELLERVADCSDSEAAGPLRSGSRLPECCERPPDQKFIAFDKQ